MDPFKTAMERFRQEFAAFRDTPDARLLRIVSGAGNVEMLGKLLRIEEWDLTNRCPFLVLHSAYTEEGETFEAMCRTVTEHYDVLKKGLEQTGTTLPEFGIAFPDECPLRTFVQHVRRFVECTREALDPPYICWLPTDVQDEGGYLNAVVTLVKLSFHRGLRFVLSDESARERLIKPLEFLDGAMMSFAFEIDEKELQEHFKKLMMTPPSKGQAPGTLPGSAAPDVEPPPRPGPPPPTQEQIKAAAEELRLLPMLTPEQGERLRQLIFEAAMASGEQNERKTVEAQRAAVKLCTQAGVKLEQSLMMMLLATYFLQFQREKEAEEQYTLADQVAGDARAYPQMAQIRMALGYVFLKNQRLDEAAHIYEQAAAAAVFGKSNLLYWESLRMAGTCHLQAGRKREAYLCWNAAVRRAEVASPDEIRNSGFLQISGELIKLLDEHGYSTQARAVEAAVAKAGSEKQAQAG